MAVLSESVVNRCIITSLSWFNHRLHAFAPGAYREALAWLGCERLLPVVMGGLGPYRPTSLLRRTASGAEHHTRPT